MRSRVDEFVLGTKDGLRFLTYKTEANEFSVVKD